MIGSINNITLIMYDNNNLYNYTCIQKQIIVHLYNNNVYLIMIKPCAKYMTENKNTSIK